MEQGKTGDPGSPGRGRRIMLDGFNLALEQGTGVATYARNLSYNLRDLGHEVGILYGSNITRHGSDLIKEISFFDPPPAERARSLRLMDLFAELALAPRVARAAQVPINGAVISTAFKSRMPYFDAIWNAPALFENARLYFRLFRRMRAVTAGRGDIAHWTYPLPLRIPGAKNIYTLHDLVPLRLPFTTLDRKSDYLRLVKQVVRSADHICTVSECSKRDIMSLLGVPEDKITNTYQSVEIPSKYLEKPDSMVADEVAGSFGLEHKGYILFHGAIEPKKNVGRIIEAHLAANRDTPLVIVGKKGWKSDKELKLLFEDHIRTLVHVGSEIRVKRRVIRIEYVPFPLLVSLIRGAKAVAFPSLYEGFGLPVLEAMLCGTPVLTSKEGATSEVAGDAALLVDPYDTREIRDGLIALDEDAELRGNLSKKGLLRAQHFGPDKYQKRLQSLYKNI